MTALLVLEAEEGRLDRTVRVDPDAVFGQGAVPRGGVVARPASGRAGLGPGVAQEGRSSGLANDAAEALAIEESGSVGAFVTAMNARAHGLRIAETSFASPRVGRSRSVVGIRHPRCCERFRRTAFRRLVASRNVVVRSDSGAATADPESQRAAVALSGGFRREDRVYGGRRVLPRRDGSTRRARFAVVLGGRDEVFSRRPRS